MIYNMLDAIFSFYVMVFLEHLHLQCNPRRFASLLQTTQFLLSEHALGAPILLTDRVLSALISAASPTPPTGCVHHSTLRKFLAVERNNYKTFLEQ